MNHAQESLRDAILAMSASTPDRRTLLADMDTKDVKDVGNVIKATKEKVLPAVSTLLDDISPDILNEQGELIKISGWSMLNPSNWGKLVRLAKSIIKFTQAVITAYKQP